jgi:hypothetical protein
MSRRDGERRLIPILSAFAQANPDLVEDLKRQGKVIHFPAPGAMKEFIDQMDQEAATNAYVARCR